MSLGFYFISFENYAITCRCVVVSSTSWMTLSLCSSPLSFKKSCSCWVRVESLLLTAASAGSWWWPNDRSFDDRIDSAAAAENELGPVALICDFCEEAPHPADDKFWLVVISVACASHRIRHIGCRSCGKPSTADNTKDMALAATAAPDRASVLCSWLPPPRYCCTSTDD